MEATLTAWFRIVNLSTSMRSRSSERITSTISEGRDGLTKVQARRFRLRRYSSRNRNTSEAVTGRRDCSPRQLGKRRAGGPA